MLKVLEVISALGCGGVERLLHNYMTELQDMEIEIDIVTFDGTDGMLFDEFKKLGYNIYNATRMRENFFRMMTEIDEIIKKGNYDVVHCHQGYLSLPAICIAKKYKVPVRIAHSHFAFIPETPGRRMFRKLITFFVKREATMLYGCGKDAAEWAWGKYWSESDKNGVMNNAINTDKFKFDKKIREKLRHELNIENKYVIGNVARHSYQKNHEFLLRSFKRVYERDKNALLMLVGDGELFEQTKGLVDELEINDGVMLMGARKDVNILLNAMDMFVLPSRFEGLPVTVVEAQCNGLPCCISENVTKEVRLSDNAVYLGIEENDEIKWAEHMMSYPERYDGEYAVELVKKGGYDIKEEADRLFDLYKTESEYGRR